MSSLLSSISCTKDDQIVEGLSSVFAPTRFDADHVAINPFNEQRDLPETETSFLAYACAALRPGTAGANV